MTDGGCRMPDVDASSSESPDVGAAVLQQRRPRILLVEDDEMVREVIKLILELKAGIALDVESVGDGLTARQRLQERDYDLVITDLMMPGLSGMELIETARAMNPPVPIGVLSAFGWPGGEDEPAGIAVAFFLTKPFLVDDLVQTVRKALNSSTGQHEEIRPSSP
jgi:CheY-like chemotaxis protein